MLNEDVLRQQGAHQDVGLESWMESWGGSQRAVCEQMHSSDLRPQGCVIECSFKTCVSCKDVIGSDGPKEEVWP